MPDPISVAGSGEGSTMKAEVFLPENYTPAEDEPFMNERQLEYFRRKLLIMWKHELIEESRSTVETSAGRNSQHSRRGRPRQRGNRPRAGAAHPRPPAQACIAKIDSALRRIEEGEYGYCEVTGEPISLKRLDARPIATMSLEAQERHERREKVHRDD
jgi:DnaK suppressor protein